MDETYQDRQFEEIYKLALKDTNVLGLIVAGGRGKGMFTEHSDYDLVLISTNDSAEKVKTTFSQYKIKDGIELAIKSLEEFNAYAAIGSTEEWDRYTYSHVTAKIDKTKDIQRMIDEKGNLPTVHVKRVSEASLDGYINSVYRSMKNWRDGNKFASHLDANESIPLMLRFIFAIEGRIRPYNKFLKWELENFPLEMLPMTTGDLLAGINQIITTGNIEIQKDIYHMIISVANTSGYKNIIDGWKGYYFG